MEDETIPRKRYGHVAVCQENNILLFGGGFLDNTPLSYHVIWMFNIYTEQWSKHMISESETAPHHIIHACAVAIEDDVYVFGGVSHINNTRTNALWTLKGTSKTSFVWHEIVTKNNMKAPSPRFSHQGWDYAGNLWVFGGNGPPLVGYLSDNGEHVNGYNNQLLSFDPSSQEWTNPKSSGTIPSPRAGHTITTIRHKVWCYGGIYYPIAFDELYELNMSSLIWTQIQTGHPTPRVRYASTLNAISGAKLALHGGIDAEDKVLNDTWILDIPSRTWKQYKSNTDLDRYCHTSTMGVNGCTVIIGGIADSEDSNEDYSTPFLIMLEPKRLQQLAMQMIFKHRVELPWQHLPHKQITLLGISASEENINADSIVNL